MYRSIIAGILLSGAALAAEAESDFKCSDPDAIEQWSAARERHQGTSKGADLDRLWQLRVRLCGQLAAGRISLRSAQDAFEAERQRTLEKWGAPRKPVPGAT